MQSVKNIIYIDIRKRKRRRKYALVNGSYLILDVDDIERKFEYH